MLRVDALLILAAGLALATPCAGQMIRCNASNVNLSLGTYDGYRPRGLDSSGPFFVTCTRDGGPRTTTVTVGLGPSLNSRAINTRSLRLSTGNDLLTYNLYRDISRLLVWGDRVGTNTVSQNISLDNGTSGTLTFMIFGRIDALQDVRAGNYRDSVTVTVSF